MPFNGQKDNCSIFATTALVATAGVASADIALSGSAQMGIQGGSGFTGADANENTTQFVQDIDITFTMSGTSDNGLTFGAAIDLDETPVAVDTNDGGVAIFVSGDFGTLTMGDTDGAFDWALQEVNFNGAASINDDHTVHAGFNGNGGLDGVYDGQIVRYDYSFGDFAFAVSVEADDDQNNDNLANDGLTGDPIWGIGGKYSGAFAGGTFGVGIGYQFVNDGDPVAADNQGGTITGLSLNVALDSGFSGAVNYSIINGTGTEALEDGVHTGLGVSYSFDAITLHANYGHYNWDAAATEDDASGYGLSAAYDFGGGLSAHLGYGYSNPDGPSNNTSTWSLGLNMSF